MNPPYDSPLDPIYAAELVVRAIDAIDAGDEVFYEILLSDLLTAAWGSALAQMQ
jgi:hypothetical protein